MCVKKCTIHYGYKQTVDNILLYNVNSCKVSFCIICAKYMKDYLRSNSKREMGGRETFIDKIEVSLIYMLEC